MIFNPFLFSIDINTATREPDTSTTVWAAGWAWLMLRIWAEAYLGELWGWTGLVHPLKQDSNWYPHKPQLKRLCWHRISFHCTKPFRHLLEGCVLIQVLRQGVIPSGRQAEKEWNWKWSCTVILWDLRKGIAMSSWGSRIGKDRSGHQWIIAHITLSSQASQCFSWL